MFTNINCKSFIKIFSFPIVDNQWSGSLNVVLKVKLTVSSLYSFHKYFNDRLPNKTSLSNNGGYGGSSRGSSLGSNGLLLVVITLRKSCIGTKEGCKRTNNQKRDDASKTNIV